MKNIKLAVKIWLLIGLTWGIGTFAAIFLMYRSQRILQDYEDLFQREVRLQDSARQMQVRFKIQVQDWKDILLRGHDPEALRKYTAAFHDEGNAVRQLAELLCRDLPDPQLRSLADEFARSHAELGRKCTAGLESFGRAKGQNARNVDAMVKGQDRQPTALIDKLV